MAISDYEATFTMARRYSPQWVKAQFNDEIQQQQQLGIGQAAEELSVTWILSRSDGNSLDDELQALANARTPFSYQPPNWSTSYDWQCSDWTKRFLDCRQTRIDAVFIKEAAFSAESGPAPPPPTVTSWVTGVTNVSYTNDDLTASGTATGEKSVITDFTFSSGKYYIELELTSSNFSDLFVGVLQSGYNSYPGGAGSGGFGIASTRTTFTDIGGTASGSGTWSGTPVVFGVAVDADAKKAWMGAAGSWVGGGDPAAGTSPSISGWTGTPTFGFGCRLYYSTDSVTIVESPAYKPSGFTLAV